MLNPWYSSQLEAFYDNGGKKRCKCFMPTALTSHKCPGLDDKLDGYVPYKLSSDSIVVILLTFI